MNTPGYPLFDADQHYYEPIDAFTRHLPKGWSERTVEVAEVNGRLKILVGGRVNKSISNPLFDPVALPGALEEYFRGNPEGKDLTTYLAEREPLPAYYRGPAARLEKLDEQRIDYAWVLPTVAMTVEELLQFDPEATAVAYHAFNEWLLDDWGFEYEGRIFTPPYLAMGDIDRAVQEVEWALDHGARFFVVRPSATYTREGWRSPGDPCFDPVWARINEAGAAVVSHVGDVGSHGLERYEQNYDTRVFLGQAPPLEIVMGHSRPISNYLAAVTCDRLFERFPNVRIASVENGADCLPLLTAGLRRAGRQRPGYFKSDPLEQFREHVWIAPFWEDDIDEAIEYIGADRVLFGSDWPHVEGLKNPRDYESIVEHLGADDRQALMYANCAELTGLGVTVSRV